MLTNKFVEISLTPLTTAPRRPNRPYVSGYSKILRTPCEYADFSGLYNNWCNIKTLRNEMTKFLSFDYLHNETAVYLGSHGTLWRHQRVKNWKLMKYALHYTIPMLRLFNVANIIIPHTRWSRYERVCWSTWPGDVIWLQYILKPWTINPLELVKIPNFNLLFHVLEQLWQYEKKAFGSHSVDQKQKQSPHNTLRYHNTS